MGLREGTRGVVIKPTISLQGRDRRGKAKRQRVVEKCGGGPRAGRSRKKSQGAGWRGNIPFQSGGNTGSRKGGRGEKQAGHDL